MKILVFSDSHGNTSNMSEVLRKCGGEFQAVVHLGDHYGDMNACKAAYPKLVFHEVIGNNDYGTGGPDELVITARGRRILLTHGHRYGHGRLTYLAEERQVAACLYGHTHVAAVAEHNGILYLNPGSIYLPRDSCNPTYAVLDISDEGVIKPSVVEKSGGLFRVKQI